MQLLRIMVLGLTAFTLAACEEEQKGENTEPAIRAIKHMTLDQRAGLQQRRIAGVVTAAISTNVGFEIGGQVIELLRQAGDRVDDGELIARLDPEPSRLRMAQSENSLAQSQATLDDSRKKFEQQRKLRAQGYATQTAFDSAEATLKNAEGAVGVAESSLDLARRDLAKTDLKAPFAGVIGRREVDVFQEVTGGQPIYSIQSDGEDKIEASLPETLINTVSLGSTVEVNFPPLGGVTVKGVVDEIAPLAGDANAYPIEVRLEGTPPGLRAGMSAELIFRFETEATGNAFMVPMTALKPKVGQEEASVFVYNADSGTLSERGVQVTNVENNSMQVVGDLSEGEVIATAGVSFLHDGMKVTLFDAELLK
ncbi:MAG: efflux RND transporter periplasmic adaptor subunit [Pseudomonadota bacterium]